jgi:hypothetical protein
MKEMNKIVSHSREEMGGNKNKMHLEMKEVPLISMRRLSLEVLGSNK